MTEESTATMFLLMDEICLESSKQVIEWIFDSNYSFNKPKQLDLLICSPGGDLCAAFALVDVMRGSTIPIRTVGLGQIASSGLIIYIAGELGSRILTPNTSILSHQYTCNNEGKHHELIASMKEYDLSNRRIINHYKKYTSLEEQKIIEILLPSHDVYLSADEALKYGLCDVVKDL